jgi:ATP-dependent DNA helicase RecG
MVLLGVDDDGTVRGITRGNLEEWVMTACRDKIRAELIPYFETIRGIEPGKDVAVVRVARGYDVHHVWHDQHRTYYVRVGTLSREASPEELQRLFQQRGNLRAELRPISGSSFDDLDIRRLRDYFRRVRQQETPEHEDPAPWITLLINTEIMTEEGGQQACTLAGLLLFGRNPGRFLPHAGIDAVAYPGPEKTYAARERASVRGSLTPLFTRSGRGEVLLEERGLVEQAVDFVRRNTRVEVALEDGARRTERWTYPEEAVREAIVNAVVHRDYLLSGTDTELAIYSDRLEVISPGRLPNAVTPDRMRAGCRSARNQLLKDVMRDYGYLEHMGMGIPRKIVRSMRGSA